MELKTVGRYEIEKELGHGAMAVVYRARDPLIGRTIAIKTIRLNEGSGMDRATLEERLGREARSAGQLAHPNIVTIYDVGKDGNTNYIAMEFVEGVTLDEWLRSNPNPPIPEVLRVVRALAAALDYAHTFKVVHRDIKPGNILVALDGTPKIADFGIAKLSHSNATQTGAVIGTPAYMSPEQIQELDLDGRSDLYSLGAIFYELLCGKQPFQGQTITTTLYRVIHEDPQPPSRHRPEIDERLDLIARRLLAKDREQRYQRGSDLVVDIDRLTQPAPFIPAGSAAPASSLRHRSPSTVVLLSMAGVMAVGAAGFFAWRTLSTPAASVRPAPPPAPAPAPKPDPPPSPRVPDPGIDAGGSGGGPGTGAAAETGTVELVHAARPYPVALWEEDRQLQALEGNGRVTLPAGEHRLSVRSRKYFLNLQLPAVTVVANRNERIRVPSLTRAVIGAVPGAFEALEISIDGRAITNETYPLQYSEIAATSHRIAYRWTAGPHRGKSLSLTRDFKLDALNVITADPAGGRVIAAP